MMPYSSAATLLDEAGPAARLTRASELRGRTRVWAPDREGHGSGPGLPGVPRGHVTEWAGPRSAGKTAALRWLIREVRSAGSGVAYVDGGGTLAPAPWAGEAAAGPPFWVVRPPAPADALVAAEELLRSGAFGLVIAEPGEGERGKRGERGEREGRGGGDATWPRARVVRLQRLARDRAAALVAVVDRPGRVPIAGLRIEFEVAGPYRRRIRIHTRGSAREVACVQSLPYRLPEDSGLPDRRA